ncbi:MAG: DUF692 domain-containing protein [Thiomonas sp.]
MNLQTPCAGIGLRQPHYREFRASQPDVGFVEVHSENFFNPHDAAAQVLAAVRTDHAVSLHGVGLALGSACGLDGDHLERLAALVARIEPVQVSDHACFARAPWAAGGEVHANDLLPVAFTETQLDIFCTHVQQVQDRLRRPILVENLSAYLHFGDSEMHETEFFAALCKRTGCGLLLDVNNLMVNARNAHEAEPLQAVCDWLDRLAAIAAPGVVGEIHLAGHSEQKGLVIDDHSTRVSLPVWMAYAYALRRLGPAPVLIEWDTALPALDVLLDEAAQARVLLNDAAQSQSGPPTRTAEQPMLEVA